MIILRIGQVQWEWVALKPKGQGFEKGMQSAFCLRCASWERLRTTPLSSSSLTSFSCTAAFNPEKRCARSIVVISRNWIYENQEWKGNSEISRPSSLSSRSQACMNALSAFSSNSRRFFLFKESLSTDFFYNRKLKNQLSKSMEGRAPFLSWMTLISS